MTVNEVCARIFGNCRIRVVGCYNGKVLASTKETAKSKCGDKDVQNIEARIVVPNKHDQTIAVPELVLWVPNFLEEMEKMKPKGGKINAER